MESVRRYRILCLHGIGTNSKVFEAQTATLRYQLGDSFEFEFVDGGYLWPAANGIATIFGTDQFYRSYVDDSPGSIRKAVRDLARYGDKSGNGPFDAVMGFSLGAALALMLLLHARQIGQAVPFKSAILLCATLPCDWTALEKGEVRPLSASDIPAKIAIPTVHFWSSEDSEYPGQSAEVVQMCSRADRIEVVHHAGHGLPTRGEELEELTRAIRMVVGADAV